MKFNKIILLSVCMFFFLSNTTTAKSHYFLNKKTEDICNKQYTTDSLNRLFKIFSDYWFSSTVQKNLVSKSKNAVQCAQESLKKQTTRDKWQSKLKDSLASTQFVNRAKDDTSIDSIDRNEKNKYRLKRIEFDYRLSIKERSHNATASKYYAKGEADKSNNPEFLLEAGKSALASNEYVKAKKWFKKLLEIQEAKGKESLELANALHQMGNLHLSLGQYAKATPLFLRALSLKEKILTPEHESVASTHARLGDLYKATEKYDKALSFYLRALAIYEKHVGLEDMTVADIWMDLGDIYLQKRLWGKAEKFYLRSVAINKKSRGSDHPIVVRLNSKTGRILTSGKRLRLDQSFLNISTA